MIHKTKTLLALTASAIVGSANAAVTYINENFEGGTPNYTIDNTGAGTLTQLQDGDAVNITATTALTGTGFVAGSPTLMGVLASGEPTNLSPGGIIPGGQHAFVSGSANRSLRLASPMTLVTDGAQSMNISFAYMLYGLGTSDFTHTLELAYSALGDFTDAVQIATFTVTPATPQDTWNTASLSITSTDVTFTDTANLRLNKQAPFDGTQIVLLDDITVTGVIPEPTTAALVGLAGFALLRRRRN